ncbi:response regulator transcription factor [Clavibacter phaseoli]|uniref:response regulator transcription factor n=1 Tax=Clavibacter phaseoli TaxID=1734031 RepID=UPI002351DCC0|nr:response regulator transcription factor [Clavibacter phaseoli]UKF29935.1 response regulator transcription factor [Clavibacter phaseoli]UKF35853.1 response regulator transcription factor [Clavibacter phaseoli]
MSPTYDPARADAGRPDAARPDPTRPDPLRGRRILVVEDDPTVNEVVCRYLKASGFQVETVADGLEAVRVATERMPDLVVLDRMLPGLDGLEVCRRIRAHHPESPVPVVMLTALGQGEDRVNGLDAGADDYLAKPFSPRELVLRVRAVLRRTVPEAVPEPPFVAGPFVLDLGAREIHQAGAMLSLTSREFDLLAFLLRNPRRVFGRDDLLRSVWGWEIGDLSTVTVHVRRLREKIEADPAHPVLLGTVWGVGYRFDPDAATPVEAPAPAPASASGDEGDLPAAPPAGGDA